ncbi:MAG TPA: hypothetical protein VIM63_17605, partial [Rhodoferax sp.]
ISACLAVDMMILSKNNSNGQIDTTNRQGLSSHFPTSASSEILADAVETISFANRQTTAQT